jgi:ABC-2 type transport system ATP-binding protein
MGGDAIRTENLVRVYRILGRGFYDPGVFYEALGSRFAYEVFMKALVKKVDVYALNSVNLTFREGDFVCLLGPNGSGKTTLIKILAGIIPPSSGRAEVMGYDVVRERKEVVKRVTYIPSLAAAGAWAQPRLTVKQNLRFMSRLFNFPFEDVLDAARKLGLEEVMDRPFGALSTGQQARVGLLFGILRRSPVYLLDEPTMGLSPEAARILRNFLVDLNREFKVTVLYATHHPLEAQEVASRVVIMDRGRVIADGTPEQLIWGSGLEESIALEVYGAYFDLRQALQGLGVNYVEIRPVRPEACEYEVVVGVKDSDEALPKLLTELLSRGTKVSRLRVRRANLEDAYLYYVGAARKALLKGVAFGDVAGELFPLTLQAAVLIPVRAALLAYSLSLKRRRATMY